MKQSQSFTITLNKDELSILILAVHEYRERRKLSLKPEFLELAKELNNTFDEAYLKMINGK